MKNDCFGWMKPDGTVIQCEIYDHLALDTIAKITEGRAHPSLSHYAWELECIRNSCTETQKQQGVSHAEWHTYEIASARYRDQAVRYLYEEGFLRFGSFTSSDGTSQLEFEGTKTTIDQLRQIAVNFALRTGRWAIFTIRHLEDLQ